jgi:hypothetical protein
VEATREKKGGKAAGQSAIQQNKSSDTHVEMDVER